MSYINNEEFCSPESAAQILETPNKYCNLKTLKMGKFWHFIFVIVDTLKQTFFYNKDTKRKLQKKYNQVASRKALSL
jgi:hypothetical protein